VKLLLPLLLLASRPIAVPELRMDSGRELWFMREDKVLVLMRTTLEEQVKGDWIYYVGK
jgi:hypothetical protein